MGRRKFRPSAQVLPLIKDGPPTGCGDGARMGRILHRHAPVNRANEGDRMMPTSGRLAKVDDYLRRIEEELRTKGVNAAQRTEVLAELKSHLIDRTAEFQ